MRNNIRLRYKLNSLFHKMYTNRMIMVSTFHFIITRVYRPTLRLWNKQFITNPFQALIKRDVSCIPIIYAYNALAAPDFNLFIFRNWEYHLDEENGLLT